MTQLTLCPHSPQIYSRTNVPAQRVHGGLLGGMSHVEKSELDKLAILISVADAHDPSLSCQFHHHTDFGTPLRKHVLHQMLNHPFAQFLIRYCTFNVWRHSPYPRQDLPDKIRGDLCWPAPGTVSTVPKLPLTLIRIRDVLRICNSKARTHSAYWCGSTPSKNYKLICPTWQETYFTVVADFPLNPSGKSKVNSRQPVPPEGRRPSSRTLGQVAVDAAASGARCVRRVS